jgi:hypothetical protein
MAAGAPFAERFAIAWMPGSVDSIVCDNSCGRARISHSNRISPASADVEGSRSPADVLLIVDRDNAPRTADLREEAVEAIERGDVEHAGARKRSAPSTARR